MQHGDETDETHGHAQNHHRRDLQSRRLVRVKSQHASLRRSSRVPLRVGRRDASTHRTYARHDDRTDAAHRHRQSRVIVSHPLARSRSSASASFSPRVHRSHSRARSRLRFVSFRRARVVARALSRAIDRIARRTRGRATARDETHPTCSPSRGEVRVDGWMDWSSDPPASNRRR